MKVSEKRTSVVTETVPEPETAVFLSEPRRTETEVFWSQGIWFHLPTFVFIYGAKPMSWFR